MSEYRSNAEVARSRDIMSEYRSNAEVARSRGVSVSALVHPGRVRQ
jgi:hypothetical protein